MTAQTDAMLQIAMENPEAFVDALVKADINRRMRRCYAAMTTTKIKDWTKATAEDRRRHFRKD